MFSIFVSSVFQMSDIIDRSLLLFHATPSSLAFRAHANPAYSEDPTARYGLFLFNPFMPTVPTFAVRETTSLGIMGEPRVPPLNLSETIVF